MGNYLLLVCQLIYRYCFDGVICATFSVQFKKVFSKRRHLTEMSSNYFYSLRELRQLTGLLCMVLITASFRNHRKIAVQCNVSTYYINGV
jgi:hypothetical protein